MHPTLIYCANGNRQYAQIATDTGFAYGAQLPGTTYHAVYFADQNWKKPNRVAYMAALDKHRPHMATVLDWERAEQLPEVLDWAEDAAQYVEQVLIVPKVIGGVGVIPERIGGRDVVLAYSVPTKFGGSSLPLWELGGRRVHLLGGSPHRQMTIYCYLRNICEVVSVDGNYHNKMSKFGKFWENDDWVSLKSLGLGGTHDGIYEAFRRSCINIMAAWARDGR